MPTYAITTATYQRRTIFQRTANAELLLDLLFHYRDQGRYLLHGFAIMPDHLHVLLTPASGQPIERCAQCIKGGFSFKMREQFRGEIWQPGFHEHRVRDEQDFANQLAYIAANPSRKRLNDYEFVHTRVAHRIDPIPVYLTDKSPAPSAGTQPIDLLQR
ncbi:MAG: REP-associated tyrosine transposase [Acidobacteriota bacterium]